MQKLNFLANEIWKKTFANMPKEFNVIYFFRYRQFKVEGSITTNMRSNKPTHYENGEKIPTCTCMNNPFTRLPGADPRSSTFL